jgi:hypothetical protein
MSEDRSGKEDVMDRETRHQQEKATESSIDGRGGKPYRAPQLLEFGTVTELTRNRQDLGPSDGFTEYSRDAGF